MERVSGNSPALTKVDSSDNSPIFSEHDIGLTLIQQMTVSNDTNCSTVSLSTEIIMTLSYIGDPNCNLRTLALNKLEISTHLINPSQFNALLYYGSQSVQCAQFGGFSVRGDQ